MVKLSVYLNRHVFVMKNVNNNFVYTSKTSKIKKQEYAIVDLGVSAVETTVCC